MRAKSPIVIAPALPLGSCQADIVRDRILCFPALARISRRNGGSRMGRKASELPVRSMIYGFYVGPLPDPEQNRDEART